MPKAADQSIGNACLICFAKAPVLGTAKTRLAVDIGKESAHQVYLELLARSSQCLSLWPYQSLVYYTGDYHTILQTELAVFQHQAQVEGDLGTRLLNAALCILDQAPQQPVILIGTDCPEISVAHLLHINTQLQNHDVVFGPAADGGYWAIGLAHRQAAEICLSSLLPWSQANLLEVSQAKLYAAGLSYSCVTLLNDLDTLDDLKLAQKQGFPSLEELKRKFPL